MRHVILVIGSTCEVSLYPSLQHLKNGPLAEGGVRYSVYNWRKCALPQYKHVGKLLTSRIFIKSAITEIRQISNFGVMITWVNSIIYKKIIAIATGLIFLIHDPAMLIKLRQPVYMLGVFR